MQEVNLIGIISVGGGGSLPVLETLNVNTNGTYTPPSGVDGYNEVNVNVPIPAPVLETLNIISNGSYTPPSGVDGYNEVNVNVPIPTPVLRHISIFENGEYTPPSGVDGYDSIIVDVPIKSEVSATFTENGTYTPPANKVYNEVIVNVPALNKVYSNDNKIVMYYDSTSDIYVVELLGLEFNSSGIFDINNITNETIKNFLTSLSFGPIAQDYSNTTLTNNDRLVTIDNSVDYFRLYNNALSQIATGAVWTRFYIHDSQVISSYPVQVVPPFNS